MFGEQEVAAGVGYAYFGLQDIEAGGDSGALADRVFVKKGLGDREAEFAHDELFAGEGKDVVGGLDVANYGEHCVFEIVLGPGDAETGFLDSGAGDGYPEALKKRLLNRERKVAVVNGVEQRWRDVGRLFAAIQRGADFGRGTGGQELRHSDSDGLVAGVARGTDGGVLGTGCGD